MLIQWIAKGTLRATEVWTDGRHAEDDKHVELDYELAVALAQNMANAIESQSKARSDVTGSRLRLKDGERLYPKSWSGNAPLAWHAREVAAGPGYVDPKHEPGKLLQRITKGALRATEAWSNGRYAEDDTYVELDDELAVALANVTEGAARATVLKVTQTEPSHAFLAWQALVDVYAPKSSNCDAQEMQGCEGVKKKGSQHGH